MAVNCYSQELREKCPYSELFWSVFSRIRTVFRISPYLVQMRENTDQNNSKYGCFLRSEAHELNLIWTAAGRRKKEVLYP